MASGKLNYDCKASGCFNLKKRPKWEVFKDCLSRDASISDIDGIVDANGKAFLIFEWKDSDSENLSEGQYRLYTNITKASPIFTAVIIYGNAETMEVRAIYRIRDGGIGEREPMDIKEVRRRLCWWWRCHLPASEIPAYDLDHRVYTHSLTPEPDERTTNRTQHPEESLCRSFNW